MSHFMEMDWNTKWDWDSFAAYGSKTTENSRKLQLLDWTIIDDGEIDVGSFNFSMGGGNDGASGSDGGHVSSAKSSISTSDSDRQTQDFLFMTYEDFSGNVNKNTELEGTKVGTSPMPKASIVSAEPLIGLKLGKRTYFENSGAGGHVKNISFVKPTASTTSLKKIKSQSQNLSIPHCIVEGCNIDLSAAKEYHRKHRVCDHHSKSPKVVVEGRERRFCQQCSRFHNQSEFDDNKRSCRRRLSNHNARRRKPRGELIQLNSTGLSSPFYGGRQQKSCLINNDPLVHSTNLGDTTWDNMCNSKFILTNGCRLKSMGDGVSDAAQGFGSSKRSVPDVLNPGPKGSQFRSQPKYEYGRALSLLSSNSSMPIHGNVTHDPIMPMLHGIPQGSSPQHWLPTIPPHHPLETNSNFQDFQLFITPYDYECDHVWYSN